MRHALLKYIGDGWRELYITLFLHLCTLTLTRSNGQPLPTTSPLGFTDISEPFASSEPHRIKVAFLGPLNAGNINTNSFGAPGLFNFKANIDLINNRSSTWRAAGGALSGLPRPLCGDVELEPIWFDTQSDPGLSATSTYDAIAAGAAVIIGEFQTANSLQVQYITRKYGVPQLSPAATGLEFTKDHTRLYPTFLRNIPHLGAQAFQMTHAIKDYFGWSKIAIVATSDSFGNGGMLETSSTAAAIGVEVLATVSFNIGDIDLHYQIERLVESKARIFVFWGLVGDLQSLWRAIATGFAQKTNPNLLGDTYAWVICHAAGSRLLYQDASGTPLPDIMQIINGALMTAFYADQSQPEFRSAAQWLASRPAWSVTPTVHAPAMVSAAVWDAVTQVAMGLDLMVQAGKDPSVVENRAELYEAIRNRTFVGVSGKVQLDANGDRKFGMGLFNFQRKLGTFVHVGSLSSTGVFTLDTSASSVSPPTVNGILPPSSAGPIEFMGTGPGDHLEIPKDTPERPVIRMRQGVRVGMLVLGAATILFIFGIQLGLRWHRKHAFIRGSSPLFLALFTLGVQLLASSIVARSQEGVSEKTGDNSMCDADLFTTNMGYTLLAGALLVKLYRLSSILHGQALTSNMNRLGDEQLLCGLGLLLILESILLTSLHVSVPMRTELGEYDGDSDYWSCRAGDATVYGSTNYVDSIYLPVTISTRFALLGVTALMAYRVRNLPDVFNESRQLLITIYNLLLISALLPAIDATTGRGKEASLIAYSVCTAFICLTSVSVMTVPKFIRLYQYRTRNYDSHIRGQDSLGNSQSHHTKVGTSTTSERSEHAAQQPAASLGGVSGFLGPRRSTSDHSGAAGGGGDKSQVSHGTEMVSLGGGHGFFIQKHPNGASPSTGSPTSTYLTQKSHSITGTPVSISRRAVSLPHKLHMMPTPPTIFRTASGHRSTRLTPFSSGPNSPGRSDRIIAEREGVSMRSIRLTEQPQQQAYQISMAGSAPVTPTFVDRFDLQSYEDMVDDTVADLPPQPLVRHDGETVIGANSHSTRGKEGVTVGSTKKPLTFHMSESVVLSFMAFLSAKQRVDSSEPALSSTPSPPAPPTLRAVSSPHVDSAEFDTELPSIGCAGGVHPIPEEHEAEINAHSPMSAPRQPSEIAEEILFSSE